jgi:hypothetical protein
MANPKKDQEELNKLRAKEIELVKELQALEARGASNTITHNQALKEKQRISEKINSILDKTEATTRKIHSATSGVVDETKDYADQLQDIADLTKKAATFGQKNVATAKLLENYSSQTRQLEDKAKQNAAAIEKYAGSTNSIHKKIVKEAQSYKSVSDATIETAKQLVAFELQRVQNTQSLGKSGLENLDASNLLAAAHAMENTMLQEQGNLSQDVITNLIAKINLYKAAAAAAQEESNRVAEIADHARGIGPELLKPFDAMQSAIESLPMGGLFSKIFGLDQFGAKMNEIVVQSIQQGLAGGTANGIAHFKTMIGQTKIFGMSLKAALLPLLAAGLIIGAVMMFAQLEKQTLEISKNMGVSANKANELNAAAKGAQASSANMYATTEEIVGSMAALEQAFGNTTSFSAETATNVANMSIAFGIAVGDAAAVQQQFESMGESSKEAFQTQALTANLAEAAGVAPGKVMKDIAQNAKKAAKYFGGGTKELAKAAVEAARLGMTLGDMTAMADGLLDIESSIKAEFEASVMLGKTINMDKARQLALEGDIAGAAKEVLAQAGSLEELTAMAPLQRKKIAEAAGMEVGQLMDAAKLQEQMNNMTAEQKKRYEEASKALEGATLSPEDLVAQQEAALQTKQMSATFDKIKNTLIKSLMPAISAITDIFSSVLSPVLEVIGGAFKGFMIVLTPVFIVVKAIAALFGGLAPVLKIIAGLFGAIYAWKAMIYIKDQASLAMAKTKLFFSKSEEGSALRQNIAEKMGLGYKTTAASVAAGAAATEATATATAVTKLGVQEASVAAAGAEGVAKKGNLISDAAAYSWALLTSSTKRAELYTLISIKAQKVAGVIQDAASYGWALLTSSTKRAELLTSIAINAQKAWGFIKDVATNALLIVRAGIEQGMLVVQGAINLAKGVGNALAAGGIAATLAQMGAAIAGAIPAIFSTFALIPFGLGIPLAIAAIAGMIGMASSFMNDGVVSPQSGSSGYGSRVLFGPEGSISFNNKDTIVAGTDLFANDAVLAPKGSIKMNDGVIGGGMGDMPDPPESMIVDLSAEAVKKFALAVGMGTLVGSLAAGLLLKMIPQMTFELNPMTFGGIGGMIGGLVGGLVGGGVGAAMGGGGGSGGEATLDTIAEKLDQLIAAAGGSAGKSSAPVQIVIGNKVIQEIASKMNVNKSYNIGHGSAGEEG